MLINLDHTDQLVMERAVIGAVEALETERETPEENLGFPKTIPFEQQISPELPPEEREALVGLLQSFRDYQLPKRNSSVIKASSVWR